MAAATAILTDTPRDRVPAPRKTALPLAEQHTLVDAIAGRDWSAYDRIVIAFSGGKDSLGCLLRLIELGAPTDKIELWHHDVDGREGSDLMDWPVTRAYCEAVADHFNLPLRYSWKVGGFEGEMIRDDSPTAATKFEMLDGSIVSVGGKGPRNTRMKFPQVAADLKVRWCSAYLKIDIGTKIFANDPVYSKGRILFVSGERRQESGARSKYAEFERHRSATKKRNIHHWRPVIDLSEEEIWTMIEQAEIAPHPAYQLGFGRVSCMACIFGNKDQWAAVRELAPDRFERIAEYEEKFGLTIQRKQSVRELADAGTSLVADKPAELKQVAVSSRFSLPIIDDDWTLPAGAYQECGGPL